MKLLKIASTRQVVYQEEDFPKFHKENLASKYTLLNISYQFSGLPILAEMLDRILSTCRYYSSEGNAADGKW